MAQFTQFQCVCPQIQEDSRNDLIQLVAQAKNIDSESTYDSAPRYVAAWNWFDFILTQLTFSKPGPAEWRPFLFFSAYDSSSCPGNESTQLTTQVNFTGIASIQLLTQASSENIDLNQLMTQA